MRVSKEEVERLLTALLQQNIDSPRIQKITDSMNAFMEFVDAGGSIKELSNTSRLVEGAGAFSEFVQSRGGSLARNEVWAILSFLAWSSYSYVLLEEEAQKYETLKKQLRSSVKDGSVVMTPELNHALRELFQLILKQDRKAK